ncbi:hypothetical protein GWK47_049277 [Chionoecetes opilio]|uniref:Uncharacterized protein n=1 Tax=Chionoecetes opilio TaxID=41210 RepID=A0A8J4Y3Q4_CHIOP|nr:hypothetical protein GWK47_049277 [Chionoecetes opilio]
MSSLLKGSPVASTQPDLITAALEDSAARASQCNSEQSVFDRVKDSVREEYKQDAPPPLTPRDHPIALATRQVGAGGEDWRKRPEAIRAWNESLKCGGVLQGFTGKL